MLSSWPEVRSRRWLLFGLLAVQVSVRNGQGPARLPSLLYSHGAHCYPYLVGVRKTGPAAGAVRVMKGLTSACGRLGSSSVT